MPRIFLDLPISPSTNRLHRGAGRNKHRTPEYDAWRAAAGWEIAAARPSMAIKALPAGCRWRSRIRVAEEEVGDVDNRIKAALDLLVGMKITPDDRRRWGGSDGRSTRVPPGRIHIWVWSIDGV